jgi:hypothetical protein
VQSKRHPEFGEYNKNKTWSHSSIQCREMNNKNKT